MTTFLLTYRNSYRVADSFLGQAIFDMDESHGELPVPVIIGPAWALGVNPGGQVLVCALPPEIAEDIPESFYDTLILHDYLGELTKRIDGSDDREEAFDRIGEEFIEQFADDAHWLCKRLPERLKMSQCVASILSEA